MTRITLATGSPKSLDLHDLHTPKGSLHVTLKKSPRMKKECSPVRIHFGLVYIWWRGNSADVLNCAIAVPARLVIAFLASLGILLLS
jgi:hypothetical protein